MKHWGPGGIQGGILAVSWGVSWGPAPPSSKQTKCKGDVRTKIGPAVASILAQERKHCSIPIDVVGTASLRGIGNLIRQRAEAPAIRDLFSYIDCVIGYHMSSTPSRNSSSNALSLRLINANVINNTVKDQKES